VSAVLFAASAATAQEGILVKEITFQGNRRWDTSSLKLKLATKEGQKYKEKVLAEDVSMLLTFFTRVTTERQVEEGGVRLTFLVEENPIVSSVIFRTSTPWTLRIWRRSSASSPARASPSPSTRSSRTGRPSWTS